MLDEKAGRMGWQVVLWDIGFSISSAFTLTPPSSRSLFAFWNDEVEGCKLRPEVSPRAVRGAELIGLGSWRMRGCM